MRIQTRLAKLVRRSTSIALFSALISTIFLGSIAGAVPTSAAGDFPLFALDQATQTADQQRPENYDEAFDRVRTSGASVFGAIVGRDPYNPLDQFRLLAQKPQDLKRPNNVNRDGIVLEIVDAQGQVFQSFNRASQRVVQTPPSGQYFFRLKYGNEVFMEFYAPVEAVGFQGPNVVFTESVGRIRQPDESGQTELKYQNLSFINLDLNRDLIGRNALPVFRVPVAYEQASVSLRKRNSGLEVHGTQITTEVLNTYGTTQSTALNILANLSDPSRLEAMEPLIESFEEYFYKAAQLSGEGVVEQAERVTGAQTEFRRFGRSIRERLQQRITAAGPLPTNPTERAAEIARRSADMKKAVEEMTAGHMQSDRTLDAIQASMHETRSAQKKTFARVQMIIGAMITPNTAAISNILHGLGISASLGQRGATAQAKENFIVRILRHPSTKYAVGLASGVALGFAFPETVGLFYHQSFEGVRALLEQSMGVVVNIGRVALETGAEVSSGLFNPVVFRDAYLTPDNFPKFAVGLTAIFATLYATIGIPHLVANTYQLVKDLRNWNYSESDRKEKTAWGRVRDAFIERQRTVQRDYLAALAGEDSAREWTEEEDRKVAAIIAELDAKQRRSPISRWIKKTFERKKKPTEAQINNLFQALGHFFFSYASFTISGRAYTMIWNAIFAVRSFVWHPDVIAATLMYPNLWNQATRGDVPTRYNGGTRNRFEQTLQRLTNRNSLAELERWENQFLNVEKEIGKVVMKKSFMALSQFMARSEELNRLYNLPAPTRMSDAALDKLTNEQRTFFRLYYEKTLEEASKAYLKQVGAMDDRGHIANRQIAVPQITPEQAATLVTSVTTQTLFNQVKTHATRRFDIPATMNNLKYQLVRMLDTQNNRQTRRMGISATQMENPRAMARAVRAMIASIIIDKPMELMFTFVMLAGVTTGILAPIQGEMFSKDSWFYLSTMTILNGFMFNTVVSVFADVWMKLQQDSKNEGSFDNVPTGEEAQRSFIWHFRKWFADKKQNSLVANWKFMNGLIWANMKAALTMYVFANMLTLGRFDLDSYVVGYMFVFLTPLSALAMKIEQAFELASGYFAKDIPENLRAHPSAAQFINAKTAAARLWFNLYYKIYENILGNYMLNFQQGQTVEFGARSFSRVVFGGFTPTEWTVSGLQWVVTNFGWVPGVAPVANACTRLFSNNYTFGPGSPAGGN